jgi:hypothetical protein
MASVGFYVAAVAILIATFAKSENQCLKQDQVCAKAVTQCIADNQEGELCASMTADCEAQKTLCNEQKGTNDAEATNDTAISTDGIQKQVIQE